MNQDKEFETYMQGKSELSQAYAELPKVALSDHLDAVILAEAHRAVSARPGAKPKRRWAIPLGMVASLLVVVMVGLQMPDLLQDARMSQVTPLPREAAAPVVQQDKSAAAPAPMAPKAEAFAPSNEPALSGNVSPAAKMASKPSAALKEQAAAPEVAAKRMRASEYMDSTNEMTLAKQKATGGPQGVLSDRAESPAAATLAAPAPAPAARESAVLKKDASGAEYSSPENWLARIKQLKQQGKQDEVKKELAAFKKRYPDYPVPGELEIK